MLSEILASLGRILLKAKVVHASVYVHRMYDARFNGGGVMMLAARHAGTNP